MELIKQDYVVGIISTIILISSPAFIKYTAENLIKSRKYHN